MIGLPEMPTLPDVSHILDLWDYSGQASEVTGFFQAFLGRLPPYFLAFFALMLFFMVIPLIFRLISEIM